MKRSLCRLLLVLFCLCLLLAGCGDNSLEAAEETPTLPIVSEPEPTGISGGDEGDLSTAQPEISPAPEESGCNEGDWGVTLLETQSLPYDSYYQVQAVIQTVPNDRFSDSVKQILIDRWAEYLALDSTNRYTFSGFPGSYGYAFDTWAEAGAWLGITPVNPLEEVDWLEPRILYTTPSKACPYEARFYGNEDGSVQFAGLDAAYWVGEAKLSLSVMMYTSVHEEAMDNIIEYGSYWAEETAVEFSSDTYTMSDGQEALLVISGPNMNGYLGVSAYFVRDGLLYDLYAVGDSPSATAEQLRQIITRALDEF